MIPLYADAEKRVEVVEEARRWAEVGLVSGAQLAAVQERYRPDLARVNLFLRVLLGVFTAVAAGALVGLPVVTLNLDETGGAVLLLLLAPIFAWVAGRHLIAGKRLYRCGAEEVLLGLAVGFLALGVALFAWDWGRPAREWGWLAAHGIALAGAVALAVRYGYALAALGVVGALAALPFHLAEVLGWEGAGLPRVALFLLLGAVALWAHLRLARREDLPRGTVWCLETARLAALAAVYLDVNLYAHRVLWGEWLGPARAAPGSPWVQLLCGVLTGLLPVGALALGVARRDRALLWFGGLSAVASVLTLKHFFHLGSLAEQLTAAGLAVAGLTLWLLRWLRAGPDRRRGAFTAEPLLEPRLYGVDAEALAAIQPVVPAAHQPGPGGFRPGGGEFGGGGATGGY
ncbi:MAG TPA: hypothetical protein VK997_03785 [Deferrisomatales bacterium]|nr:hypothetical protein [Deferrisomatales bacterium]